MTIQMQLAVRSSSSSSSLLSTLKIATRQKVGRSTVTPPVPNCLRAHRKHEKWLTVGGKKLASKANFAPIRKNWVLLATFLELYKVLVEERSWGTLNTRPPQPGKLRSPHSGFPSYPEGCFRTVSGVNTAGFTNSFVRAQGESETSWLSKVEIWTGQSSTSLAFEITVQGQYPNKRSNLGHPVGFFFCRNF